jgi:hypothetical protein
VKLNFSLRGVALLLCLMLATPSPPARADKLQTDATWIVVGIAVTGAAIGIGIYYAFHHSHSIKGCADPGADGLVLKTDSDQQSYRLIGLTAGLKPGDRVKVTGKKKKNPKGETGPQRFLVEKVSRDYGPCQAAAARP